MDEEVAREKADEDFKKKREEMRKRDEEKTGKNRKRREKNKKKKGGKGGTQGEGTDEKATERIVERLHLPKKDDEPDGDDLPATTAEDVGVIIHDDD